MLFCLSFDQLLEPGTKYNEAELVAMLKEQSNDAFNYLYDNYSGALFTIINQIVADKETTNDVLQEVFVNIWKKIDLYDAARVVLKSFGVISISGGDRCTYIESNQYFSYRRDGKFSGRMAHLIWMERP